MRDAKIGALIRRGGYEALFLVGGALAITAHPTIRNAEEVARLLSRLKDRRNLAGLRERGLIEAGQAGSTEAFRLTRLGQIAMAGGRLPEEAWTRPWDQQWRMIAFDLPEKPRRHRSRFWRWLRANYFGNLQGSLWITPDPVPAIEKTVEDFGFDPTAALVCTGRIAGSLSPRAIAAKAWDFVAIDEHYRRYAAFVERSLERLRTSPVPDAELPALLTEDRELWWSAVGVDPLLPKALAPRGYEGPRCWKLRQRLHQALARSLKSSGKSRNKSV